MNTQTITSVPATKLIEILGKGLKKQQVTPDVTEHLRKVYALAKANDPRWQDFLRLWKEEAPEELHMAVDVILSEFPTREGFCVKPVIFGKFAMVRCGKPATFSLRNTATLWCDEHVAEDCREPWMNGWIVWPVAGLRQESDTRKYVDLPGESKSRVAMAYDAVAQTAPDYDTRWEEGGAREVMTASELRQAEAPKRAASSRIVTKDGMYRNPETGEIFKVQWNRASGDGRRLYAKRMLAWDAEGNEFSHFSLAEGTEAVKLDRVAFVFAQGAMKKISPAWKLSMDDAKAFGALYGTCCNCGRTLTDEGSIAAGIGPVCAKKFN